MLTLNHRKESLARVYIQAIAGRCGMICSSPALDYGVDARIHEVGTRTDAGTTRYVESGFGIAVQAKTTSSPIIEETEIAYDLEIKTYNDLRETEVGEPRILVLLVLPTVETQWLHVTEEQLILRRCAYWMSLRGKPPTENRESIRIRIPRDNLFNVEALCALMQRRKDGDDL